MSLKKLLSVTVAGALAIGLALSFTACKKDDPCESGHTDTDKDFLCDECGVDMPCDHVDEDENYACDLCGELLEMPPAPPEVRADFSISVKDEAGNPVSGVRVTLYDGEGGVAASGSTSAGGAFSGNLLLGNYFVSFEIDDADGYIYIPATSVNIKESGNSFNYVTVDNTPDGSLEKPFFLGEDSADYTIPAASEYTFSIKGESRTLEIESELVKVIYDGNEYLPESGKVSVRVKGPDDPNDPPTVFTVVNTSDADVDVTLNFVADPGTRKNPYSIEKGETVTTAPITFESIVYYKWVADADGTVTVTSATLGNSVKITNLTQSRVSDYTSGAEGSSISIGGVAAGDDILIEVSTNSENPVAVEIILSTEE